MRRVVVDEERARGSGGAGTTALLWAIAGTLTLFQEWPSLAVQWPARAPSVARCGQRKRGIDGKF